MEKAKSRKTKQALNEVLLRCEEMKRQMICLERPARSAIGEIYRRADEIDVKELSHNELKKLSYMLSDIGGDTGTVTMQ